MAEKTEFLQAIDDAILDADSLERFINGSDSETVLTRLSAEYPTLKKAIKQMFENGGLNATPYLTKADMLLVQPAENSIAVVLDDTADNNGFYIYKSGSWSLAKYNYTKEVVNILTEIRKLLSQTDDSILLALQDRLEQTYAYFDAEANLHVKNKIFSGGIDSNTFSNLALTVVNPTLASALFKNDAVKSLTNIDSYSSDKLTKRMPFGIKLNDGRILCFYHKQVAGYDGDFAGSQLWRAFITVNDDFSVTVNSKSLFKAADTAGGVIKHPMLGRTSDGRILLIYERRETTNVPYAQYISFGDSNGQNFTEATLLEATGSAPSNNIVLGSTGLILTAKDNRLVVPMYTAGGNVFCIYSDDDGATWLYGKTVPREGSDPWHEPSITLDAEDNLLMDMRPSSPSLRGRAISYDNGVTWQFLGNAPIPSATNQGTLFYDKSAGILIQTHNNIKTGDRIKYSLTISFDNNKNYPVTYQPFADEWYGGYSQIIKLKDGLYAILIEYAEAYAGTNKAESSAVLLLSLKEILSHVNYN